MNQTPRACVAEFLGTFALVFFGVGAVYAVSENSNIHIEAASIPSELMRTLIVALAHGLILGIAITCTMAISGGQLNPAVSVGLVVAKKQSPVRAAVLIVSQLAGAVAAAKMVDILIAPSSPNSTGLLLGATQGSMSALGNWPHGLLLEAIMTFALMMAVLAGTVDARAPKLGGFVIGLTVAVCILVGGKYTGAAMNPARAFGPALVAGHWDMHWMYWAGPVIGAALAAVTYRAVWEVPARGDVRVVAVEMVEERAG